MTVRARLGLGFGIVLVLLAALAATALIQLASFNRNVEAIAKVRMVQLITVGQVTGVLNQITRSTGNVLVLDDEKQVKEELASIRVNRDAVKDLLTKVSSTAAAAGRERELYNDITTALQAYLPHEEEFLKEAEEGDYSSAKDLMLKTTRPAQLRLQEKLEGFEQYQVSLSADEANKAAEIYDGTRMSILVLSLLAVLFGLAAAMMIIRSLRAELGGEPSYAKEVASRIAEGDLTLEVQVRKGDTTSMLYAMRRMTESLAQLVGEVAEGSRTVADSSAQIAQGNLDLSQRTEEQAGTLEETASSMEELTATVTQNADNARQATQLATGASEVARRGGQVVGEVVSTMTGISDASKKISDIIGVIDGIAFQTNILALNAAVEAARAGEQGRGFAVVASEVRSLAQRSASAAKEIKDLIGDSVHKVEAGTRLVDAAGKTMNEIVAAVAKVTDLITEISTASQEQSSGIGQVNKAISQMESVVQQNASLVEEATASTESMKAQAATLLEMVSRFQLAEQGEAAPVPARASAPEPAGKAPRQVAALAPIKLRPRPEAIAGAPARPIAPKAPNGTWTTF
jgi:methyl-accepting chemotaxis protein